MDHPPTAIRDAWAAIQTTLHNSIFQTTAPSGHYVTTPDFLSHPRYLTLRARPSFSLVRLTRSSNLHMHFLLAIASFQVNTSFRFPTAVCLWLLQPCSAHVRSHRIGPVQSKRTQPRTHRRFGLATPVYERPPQNLAPRVLPLTCYVSGSPKADCYE